MSEVTTTGPGPSAVEPGMERVFTRSPLLGTNTHSLCPGCGEPSAVRVLMAKADNVPPIEGQERIRIDIFLRDNLP